MAKTIDIPDRPDEKTIEWFAKNVGPRTHYLASTIGGKGWRFYYAPDVWSSDMTKRGVWKLTVDDEKMLVFYLLIR